MKKIILYSIILVIHFSAARAQNAEEWYMKGVARMLRNEPDSAVFFLNSAIEADNSNVQFYLKRGEIFLKKNEEDKAIEDFKAANRIKEHVADLWLAKAFALKNDPVQAVSYLEQHLTSPFKKSGRLIRSDEAFDYIQDSDEWFLLWEKDWYPEEEKIREEVSYYLKNDNFIEALSVIEPKLKESKNKEILYECRADVFAAQGNYRAAILDLNLVLEKTRDPQVLKKRGDYYLKAGNYQSAVNDYTTVLRFDPADFEDYLKRAEAFEMAGNFSSAVKDIETYLNYFPDDKKILFKAGELHFKNEAYLSALKYFNRIITLDKANPDYYKARGKTYYSTRMYKLAIDDLSMALDLYPNDGETYYYKGLVRQKTGDAKGACVDWKKAAELGEKRAFGMIIDSCQ